MSALGLGGGVGEGRRRRREAAGRGGGRAFASERSGARPLRCSATAGRTAKLTLFLRSVHARAARPRGEVDGLELSRVPALSGSEAAASWARADGLLRPQYVGHADWGLPARRATPPRAALVATC